MDPQKMPVSTVVFGALFRGNHRARGGSRGPGARVHGGGAGKGEIDLKSYLICHDCL
jgi:hypothetical protein